LKKIFTLYNIIVWLGIVAYSAMFAAAVTGFMEADQELHEYVAIFALAAASIHGGLIVYKNIKVKAARKKMQQASAA